MLAGEAPYTGTSAQAIMAKRLHEPVPHVRTVRDAVPPAVDQALLRVLAKTPADRFATAEAFARRSGARDGGTQLDTAEALRSLQPSTPVRVRFPTVKAGGIGLA